MGKITKEQFQQLCYRHMENRNVDTAAAAAALDMAYRHITKGRWAHGRPQELYYADGCPCIRYQDGMSFHYDIIKGTWF